MGVYTNYAINFFILYIIGKRFRTGVHRLRKRCWNYCMRCLGRYSEQVVISPCPSHTGTLDEEGIIKNRKYDLSIREDFEKGRLSFGMTTVWSQDRKARLSIISKREEQTKMENIVKDVKDYRLVRLKQYQDGSDTTSGGVSHHKDRSASFLQTISKPFLLDPDDKPDHDKASEKSSKKLASKTPSRFGINFQSVRESIFSLGQKQSNTTKPSLGSDKSSSLKSKHTIKSSDV